MPFSQRLASIIPTLKQRHFHEFTPLENVYLAAIIVGCSDKEIAAGLEVVVPGTVRRHLAIIETKVLGPVALPSSRRLLHTWTLLQERCCTRHVLQLGVF